MPKTIMPKKASNRVDTKRTRHHFLNNLSSGLDVLDSPYFAEQAASTADQWSMRLSVSHETTQHSNNWAWRSFDYVFYVPAI